MVAAMEGVDALVFSGGAGEASPCLRADVCAALGFLGVGLEASSNETLSGDGVVSSEGTPTAVLVVQTREDLEIARHVRELLG